MKLNKQNVCVFIENEVQLQQAREVLERYNQPIYESLFELNDYEKELILIKNDTDDDWFISAPDCIIHPRTQITLTELEEILKGEKL